MESRLQRIANVLLLNSSFTSHLGLLNGKMGIAIFFYLYGQYTKNKLHENFADELIDEIYNELNIELPIDFSGGLMGIGWGIEYLVHSRFLEGDTDEILKEIDDAVYRATLRTPLLVDSDKDLYGFGLYFLSRLQGKEADDSNLNTIIKKQMLVYLHDDCERLLTLDEIFDKKVPPLTIGQLKSVLFFIIGAQSLCIFPVKLTSIEHYVVEYLRRNKMCANSKFEFVALKFLLLKCGENISDPRLKNMFKQASDTISLAEVIADNDCLISDFTKTAWNSLVYILPDIVFSDELLYEKKVFEIVDNELNWEKRLSELGNDNLGLNDGMAGLGLAILQRILKYKGLK